MLLESTDVTADPNSVSGACQHLVSGCKLYADHQSAHDLSRLHAAMRQSLESRDKDLWLHSPFRSSPVS